jgi:hypothetical protein
MLDFKNRPPRSPRDVELSESGESLLRNALLDEDSTSMLAYGRAARSEIIDSFKGRELSIAKVRSISKGLVGRCLGITEDYPRAYAIEDMPRNFADGLSGRNSAIIMNELRTKSKLEVAA